MTNTYFIQSIAGGPIKIGITGRNPADRLADLQTGSPTKLKLIGVITSDVEKDLHSRFAEHRLHGEWFSPSAQIVSYIEDNATSELYGIKEAKQRSRTFAPQDDYKHFECILDVIEQDDDGVTDIIAHCLTQKYEFTDSFDDEWDENEDTAYNALLFMLYEAVEAFPFVEKIGVTKKGFVVFFCSALKTHSRRMAMEEMAIHALRIDDEFEFPVFLVFWESGKQKAVDLRQLAFCVSFNAHHLVEIYDANELMSFLASMDTC